MLVTQPNTETEEKTVSRLTLDIKDGLKIYRLPYFDSGEKSQNLMTLEIGQKAMEFCWLVQFRQSKVNVFVRDVILSSGRPYDVTSQVIYSKRSSLVNVNFQVYKTPTEVSQKSS